VPDIKIEAIRPDHGGLKCHAGSGRDPALVRGESMRKILARFLGHEVDEYRDLHDKRRGVDPTDVECPTCFACRGWACEGARYGYHAAGYHLERHEAARQAKKSQPTQVEVS
jgi:hypothetical protein